MGFFPTCLCRSMIVINICFSQLDLDYWLNNSPKEKKCDSLASADIFGIFRAGGYIIVRLEVEVLNVKGILKLVLLS